MGFPAGQEAARIASNIPQWSEGMPDIAVSYREHDLFPVPIIVGYLLGGIILPMDVRYFFKKIKEPSHHGAEKHAVRCRKIFCDIIPARMCSFDAWDILMPCRP